MIIMIMRMRMRMKKTVIQKNVSVRETKMIIKSRNHKEKSLKTLDNAHLVVTPSIKNSLKRMPHSTLL